MNIKIKLSLEILCKSIYNELLYILLLLLYFFITKSMKGAIQMNKEFREERKNHPCQDRVQKICLKLIKDIEKHILIKLQAAYNKYAKYPLEEGESIQIAENFESKRAEDQGKMDLIKDVLNNVACTYQVEIELNRDVEELFDTIESLWEEEERACKLL